MYVEQDCDSIKKNVENICDTTSMYRVSSRYNAFMLRIIPTHANNMAICWESSRHIKFHVTGKYSTPNNICRAFSRHVCLHLTGTGNKKHVGNVSRSFSTALHYVGKCLDNNYLLSCIFSTKKNVPLRGEAVQIQVNQSKVI